MNFRFRCKRNLFYMNNYIQINIQSNKEEQKELLIALLSEEGYDGFEETENTLSAFIDEQLYNEELMQQVLAPFAVEYTKEMIAPKNWNEEWKSNYEPVIVEDFVAVRAHFHLPITNVQHEIVITPKMSFGTGHHATTWQMMKLMEAFEFKNQTVFDFGSGTGVLAILAEKLGAKSVLAIDYDDLCIENSAENILNNYCTVVTIAKGEAPPANQQFNIILANINRHILLQNMQAMSNAVTANGYLFVSGFYAAENQLLIGAANVHGLQLIKSSERHNWSSLIFQKQN
jgi:ribosomal protein L11 methyltransferase